MKGFMPGGGQGAWAVHGGRLGKVYAVRPNHGVAIVYADDGVMSGWLKGAALAAAGPAQVAEGEAQLDALGAGPSSPLGRPPLEPARGRENDQLASSHGESVWTPPPQAPGLGCARRAQAGTSSRGTYL